MPSKMEEASDRRWVGRVDVYAQAEVRGKEVAIMAVRNLSPGGVYLEGTPGDYPAFHPGLEFNLVIFGAENGAGDEEDFNIQCRARVIRIDPGFAGKRPPGFGVTIDPLDQDQRDRLTNLLSRAQGYRVTPRG